MEKNKKEKEAVRTAAAEESRRKKQKEKKERSLRISHIEKSTRLLGPYERFVIWVRGCCFSCAGCLAAEMNRGEGSAADLCSLAEEIVKSDAEGVTISGGEPFLQAASLRELLLLVKAKRDIGVIIYSGFCLQELQKRPEAVALLELTDLLIDGKYVRELDDGRAFVGSSNQKLHYLTPRYRKSAKEYYARKNRVAEIKFSPGRVALVGVPSAGVLKVWEEVKRKAGGGMIEF